MKWFWQGADNSAIQEKIAELMTQLPDIEQKLNTSAIEACAGEVRSNNGLLEQLWHIYYFGPTAAVEKIEEKWQLVPELKEPEIAGHIRACPKVA